MPVTTQNNPLPTHKTRNLRHQLRRLIRRSYHAVAVPVEIPVSLDHYALVIELREQNAWLAVEIAALKRRLEEKERSSKRQAAPFSKGKKKANPKKRGWKPGEGKFSSRDLPTEEEITHRVQVPLQGDRCPFCGAH